MTDNKNNVSLNAAFDRQLIWQRGGSVRYLVVDVTTSEVINPVRQQQLPLNLALVIDASGSMAGPPLTAACEAACRVTEGLSEVDRLAARAPRALGSAYAENRSVYEVPRVRR